MFDHKIIVFSDIHIVEEGQKILGLDTLVQFETGLRHALKKQPDVDRIMIVGDLTHHGRIPQYERLKELLDQIDLPIHLMLGNHDRRDTFLEVFPDAPVADGFVQEVIDLGETHLITLDTLDGPPYREGHHAGRLCQKRLDWLDGMLTKAGGKPVILFAHHPPYKTGFPGMDRIRLLNDDELLDLILAHQNVTMMINGHVHRTISGQVRGIPYAMFKGPSHQMPMDMKGTSSASSVIEPGAYGILCLAGSDVVVHTEDFEIAAQSEVTLDPHSC